MFLNKRPSWRAVALSGALVVATLLGGHRCGQATPPAQPAPALAPKPHEVEIYAANPLLLHSPMELFYGLLKDVRSGQKLCIVRFAPAVLDVPAEANNMPPASATRLTPGPKPLNFDKQILVVQGEFAEVKALSGSFDDLGVVGRLIEVDTSHGGDRNCQRLGVLLGAVPGDPMPLLAVGQDRSADIFKARLLGPLREEETKFLVDWFDQARRRPESGADARAEAEGWLRSPNPWLIWLGLYRLKEMAALTSTHFRTVIERRPVAETESLFNEMLNEAASNLTVRADALEVLEALLELPEKQLVVLKHATIEFRNNPVDRRRSVNVKRLMAWLAGYRERLVRGTGPKAVIDGIDKLSAVLAVPHPDDMRNDAKPPPKGTPGQPGPLSAPVTPVTP